MGWSDDYLEHHGILGQKWGVRRFENKNGTLTPAGKKRYSDPEEKKMDKAQRRLDKVTAKLKNTGTAWDNDTSNNKKMETYRKVEKKYYKELNKVEKKYNVENTGGLNDYAHYKITGKKESDKKGLSDKQKKALVIGAAAVGTAIAAYGGYKLYQANSKSKTPSPGASKSLDKAQSALKEFKSLQSSPNKPTFSKPAQNLSDSRKQEQDRISVIEQNLLKARQESLRRSQSASNVVKFNGSEKFSQAAKANDDLVQSLLKKNSASLAGYSMDDLKKLDLY